MSTPRQVLAVAVGLAAAACGGDGPTGPGTTPTLEFTSQAVAFGRVQGRAAPPSQTVTIQSSGPSALTGLSLEQITYSRSPGWLSATLDRTFTPATLTLGVAGGPLASGSYSATVTVNAQRAANNPQQIQVLLIVLDEGNDVSLSAAGQSTVFLASPAFSGRVSLAAGGQYLIAVVNTAEDVSATANFTLVGARVNGAGDIVVSAAAAPQHAARPLGRALDRVLRAPSRAALDAVRSRAQTHLHLLERGREIYRQRRPAARSPLRAARIAPAQAAISQTIGVVNQVYVVNDVQGGCGDVDSIGARTVAVGQHVIVLADTNRVSWPPSQRPDSGFYQTFADEYDQVTWPHLQAYVGDPLEDDANLSGVGKVTVTITPVLNRLGGGISGLVNVCDFLPFDGSGPDPIYSNETEMIYSGTASNSTLPVGFWRNSLRAVAAHESDHLVSVTNRVLNNSATLEESWLEEGMAQMTEEIWLRHFNLTSWKGHADFSQTVACELDLGVAVPCGTGNPLSLVLSHLPFLFAYLQGETATSEGLGKDVAGVYGAGWSMARWATDQYATDEAAFVQSLLHEPQLTGLANLSSHTGQPAQTLLAYWNLGIATFRESPRGNAADPRITFPTFDLYDIFQVGQTELTCAGQPCGLFTDSGTPVFPLEPTPITAGVFGHAVSGLPGTGGAFFVLTGSAAGTELIELFDGNGAPFASSSALRLALVRLN